MSDRTYEEAAAELKVSVSWLKKCAQARTIQHTRYGRTVRFTEADLDAIRAQHRAQPIANLSDYRPRRAAA